MPRFATERRVAHDAGRMFDLVADVERYPEFVPFCTGLRVIRRARDAEDREVVLADMSVGYKAIREAFTSRVVLDRPRLAIVGDAVEGPFRRMTMAWSFHPEGEGACRVGFEVDYEFRSRTLGLLVGSLFEKAFRKFAEAFERRAGDLAARGISA